MALETGTYVGDLVPSNPSGTDAKSKGDDHLRLIKGVLQNSLPGFAGVILAAGTDSGTANVYQVAVTPAPAAYTPNAIVNFKATHANTSAATLQINTLGAKPFVNSDGLALPAGAIAAGAVVQAIYDGTSFLLLSGNDRGRRSGDVWTGAQDFTGATPTVPTKAALDSTQAAASTAYADAAVNVEKLRALGQEALLVVRGGDTYSGAHDFTGATVTVPTRAPTDTGAYAASLDFVKQQAFAAALPNQTGNDRKFLRTAGGSAFWDYAGWSGRRVISANDTVLISDKEKLLDCSGVLTLSLATYSTDFVTYVRCVSGVTTIGAVATAYPGDVYLVGYDGAFYAIRLQASGGGDVDLIVQDQRSSNATQQNAVANVWTDRVLNTTVLGSPAASLSANRVTLQPGRWVIRGRAPYNGGNSVSSRLYDYTNGIAYQGETAPSGGSPATLSVTASVSLAAPAAFALQYYTGSTFMALSLPSSIGSTDVFSSLEATRVG